MVENAFGILVGRLRVLLTTMEQRPKFVRDIVLTCVVSHNMLRRHRRGRADTPPTPADDIQPPRNDQGEQGQDGNLRNPLREAKRQTNLLKDYFSNLGALTGQEDII